MEVEVKTLQEGKRSLKYGSIAVLVTVSVSVLFILACGAEGTATQTPVPAATLTATAGPTSTLTPTDAVAKVPISPRLKVAMQPPGSQTTLYHLHNSGSSTGILRTIYNNLIWKDRFTEEDKPMLATEWSMSPDGKKWTFKLRRDVLFHDGTEFTSKDVRRSWEITTSPQSQSFRAKPWAARVGSAENIDISNPYEVVFNLTTPVADLNAEVAESSVFPILSADYWDKLGEKGYGEKPIGTGPFKFVELQVESHMLVERYKRSGDSHWWQIPEFDEVLFQFVPEASTRLAMSLAGETHIAEIPALLMPQVEAKGIQRVRSTLPGLSFLFIFGGLYYPEPMQYEGVDLGKNYDPSEPFLNIKVRQALNLAIDREQIRRTFFGDRGTLQAIHGMVPWHPGYLAEWKPYPFDPQNAKQLLAEAGYPDGLTFDLVVPPNIAAVPEGPDIAEALVSMWQAIGVTANLKTLEFGQLIAKSQAFEMHRTVWGINFGATTTISGTWSNAVYSGVPIWHDQFLLQKYDEYAKSVDPVRRNALEVEYGK
jgi:ABC-type transport system substrate-binding protein